MQGLALFLAAAALARAATTPVDFSRDVHPILAAKCFACHSGDKRFANLSVANYAELMRGGKSGKVVSPGASRESLLMLRVLGEGVSPMPPAGERLTANEIAALRSWIDDGARPRPDAPPARPNWVPKMALARPNLPAGKARHPVDRYLKPPGRPVSDAVFARRVYLDAWGLLPTPEQLDEFTRSTASDKREALVRRLLAHNRNYSEHWITFWNDLLRNDEGVNYAGTRKSITAWLLQSLERNLPYNEFAAKLLNPAREGEPDGFLVGVNWRGDINASQTPVMQAAQNSAQVFLGVNLKCNSCHDSFVSRWKLKDAYGLASFFSAERLELVRCDNRMGDFAEPQFLYPELGGVAASATLPEKRAAAAGLFTQRENGRFARTVVNRIWKRLMGRGLVEPVDDMDAEPSSPELLDWLAADFVERGYDLKALIESILTSRAYQMPSAEPAVRRLTAEQFLDAVSAITGEWRVYVTGQGKLASHSRDWRLASSRLSRALGRPIRDQVFTERNSSATTLQALELVNGETYARFLRRASRKMLGELEPAPANLFDSGRLSSGRVTVDIDITGASQLRLLVADLGSYSPERVLAVWANARLVGPSGAVPLDGLTGAVQMKDRGFADGLRVKTPSEVVLDIGGKGYTRFEAVAGVEEVCLQSDISPSIRFFVFKEKPDLERLVQVSPETPVAPPAGPWTVDTLISRVYRHALGRDATQEERRLARDLVAPQGKITASGLADLLWCVTMLPEFQLL